MTTASADVVSRRETSAAETAQLSAVLDALGDATCRTVLRALRRGDGELTVQELAAATDVSLTSLYRKLDQLTEADLVVERAEVDPDGHRRSRYRPAVDQVEIGLGAEDGVAVTLYHAATELRLAVD